MSKGFPYSFTFKNSYGETRSVCVVVYPERTRNKKYVFKTSTCWDEPTDLQLALTEEEENAYCAADLGSMVRCHYFWSCMEYAAVLGFIQDGRLEDTVENAWGWCKGLDRPVLDGGREHYISRLIREFPGLEIRLLDNGYS